MKFIYNRMYYYIDEVIEYLYIHEKDFPIPLSNKINLEEYIIKIKNKGNSIICLSDSGKIVGLLFYYDNNKTEKKAFVSLVSVDQNFRNKGIASSMLSEMFKNLKKSNVEICDIPTHFTNKQAISLYKKFGFIQTGGQEKNGNILLRKYINGASEK